MGQAPVARRASLGGVSASRHREIGVDHRYFFTSLGRYQKMGVPGAAQRDALARVMGVRFPRQFYDKSETRVIII